MLKDKQSIKQDVFGLIHNYYKNEILEHHLQNNHQEFELLEKFQAKGSDALKDFVYNFAGRFFFFIGNSNRPNIEKILSIQEKDTKYMTFISKRLYMAT